MLLIDGHNLMYAQNCESRAQLVDLVDVYCANTNKKALIVFDGVSNIDLSTNFVQVINAGQADPRIIEIMDEYEASQLILVSSDKQLQYEARQRRIAIINSEKFNLHAIIPVIDRQEKDTPFLSDAQVAEQLKDLNYFRK